jgi:hypothetical protein
MKTNPDAHNLRPLPLLVPLVLALGLALVPFHPAGAGDEKGKKEGKRPKSTIDYQEVDSATQTRIDAGLKWLSGEQNQDGSFGSSYKLAVTSLAGIAFLASGSVPGRGPYATQVRLAQEHVLRAQDLQGLITDTDRMYTHGFATLFLAELYGMTPARHNKERVRRALAKAVGFLERIQLDSGGWWYQPNRDFDNSDISVTICQIMALRAARNAGITVKPKCIQKARQCVKSAYYRDSGGFAYRVYQDGRRSGGHAFPRSAAGTCILYYLGDYDAPEVLGGIKYLQPRKPGTGVARRDRYFEPFYYYGVYYATQAMYQAGGQYWAEWFPAVRKDLLQRQDASTGAWRHSRGHIRNTHYATAMALITLQLPNRYLPILQR